jgi:hypothetical protein
VRDLSSSGSKSSAQSSGQPILDCASSLHIDEDASTVDLAPIGILVCLGEIGRMLELHEGVAATDIELVLHEHHMRHGAVVRELAL